jgi:hypothetical protein
MGTGDPYRAMSHPDTLPSLSFFFEAPTVCRRTGRGLIMSGEGQPSVGSRVPKPEPLYVPWRGRMVRVRPDDPILRPYTPNADRLSSAMQLASDVEGCGSCWRRRSRTATTVQVPDDGSEVRPRRRT